MMLLVQILFYILSLYLHSQLERVPDGYFSMEKTHLLDNQVYGNEKYHQAFHHYIKVVSTMLATSTEANPVLAYQMIHSAQTMQVWYNYCK